MLKLLTCVHGHFWESSPPSENGELPAASKHCPTCGAPADELPLLDLAESERADLETVVPPPAPKATDLFDNKGFPILPGYEVLEALGKNRKGVLLFRAKQILINRPVLLKVVIARADVGQQSWGALRGEANTLAKFDHPNIPRIHEVGERDRQLFYNVVDWFDGAPLSERLTDKPFPPKAAAHFVENVARALHVVHERGVVHRNLKPKSLLLEPAEKKTLDQCAFKIDDLGIAGRAVEGEVNDLELQGKLPFYLAPEQVLGYAKDIGPETDVYALGVLLYELLSGRPPYRGERVSDVLERIRSRAAPPHIEARRVSRDLKAICAKCLQKAPRRRYATALELAEDLRRYREGLPVTARPIAPHTRLLRWMWRRPALACLIMLIPLLFISTFIAFLVGHVQEEDNSRRFREKANMATTAYETKVAKTERDAVIRNEQLAWYFYNINRAEAALSDKRIEEARQLLNGCPAELRRWEWFYLQNQLNNKPPRTFTPAVKKIIGLAVSPDAQHLAVAGDDAKIEGQSVLLLIDLQRGQGNISIPFQEPIRNLAFRPDGQTLAVASRNFAFQAGHLSVLSSTNGFIHFKHAISRPATVQYAPNGQSVAVGTSDGHLWLYHAQTGDYLLNKDLNGNPFENTANVTRVGFGNDNSTLFVCCCTPQIARFAAPQGFPVSQIKTPTGDFNQLAVGPDNQLITLDTGDKVRFWDTRLEEQKALKYSGIVEQILLTPDGKRLAVLESDKKDESSIVHWYDVPTQRELFQLRNLPKSIHSIALDRTGHRLVVATDTTVTIYGENND